MKLNQTSFIWWSPSISSRKCKKFSSIVAQLLVVAAISSINIYALKEGLWPFLIIVAAGIIWNVLCVVVLARHVLPDAWFERSIAEMGQSMGITATGLLLLRVVDPDYETPAADAFASKQLLHEPFMGGGLWTSAAIPLLAVHGGPLVFYIACGAMAIWLVVLGIMRYYRLKACNIVLVLFECVTLNQIFHMFSNVI